MSQERADLLSGEDGPLIGLAEAAKLLPGRGSRHPAPSCLSRWISAGATGRDGRRHRLEALLVGQSWRTTAAAVRRFVAALNAVPDAEATEVRSPGQRTKAAADAGRQLEAMGV